MKTFDKTYIRVLDHFLDREKHLSFFFRTVFSKANSQLPASEDLKEVPTTNKGSTQLPANLEKYRVKQYTKRTWDSVVLPFTLKVCKIRVTNIGRTLIIDISYLVKSIDGAKILIMK